ncbi:hypothetical protein BBP40_008485 [Aspergillus hancockii]|nr:hypothetical protein BBP40_008485 [Aspergillus hancockii]
MVRGAEYDNGIPQSDNAIEAGQTKVHGAGSSDADLSRTHKVADLPDAAKHTGDKTLSFGGSAGHSSGKGGHEPHTLGEQKGLGAHKA